MGMEWPNKYMKKGEWEERKGKGLEKFKEYKTMFEVEDGCIKQARMERNTL